MNKEIFNYLDYKAYLADHFESASVRGGRSELARAIGCASSFLSQVMRGSIHFSLEQGIKLNHHLGHNPDESHYFMLMLEHARAGSRELAEYYLNQIQKVRERRNEIRERLEVKTSLTIEDQVTYYSSWIYAGVHIALSIPTLSDKADIAAALKIPVETVAGVLDFLTARGMAEKTAEGYKIGKQRIHLSKDSPMISKHHANWRAKALQKMETLDRRGTHFSGVMGISKKDIESIRAILLEAMERTEKVIKESQEEVLYGMGIDFFPCD